MKIKAQQISLYLLGLFKAPVRKEKKNLQLPRWKAAFNRRHQEPDLNYAFYL